MYEREDKAQKYYNLSVIENCIGLCRYAECHLEETVL